MSGVDNNLEAKYGQSAEFVKTAQQRVSRLLGEDFEQVGGAEQQRRLFQTFGTLQEQGVPFQDVLVDAKRSDALDAFTVSALAEQFSKFHLDLRSIVIADKLRGVSNDEQSDSPDAWKPGDTIG